MKLMGKPLVQLIQRFELAKLLSLVSSFDNFLFIINNILLPDNLYISNV